MGVANAVDKASARTSAQQLEADLERKARLLAQHHKAATKRDATKAHIAAQKPGAQTWNKNEDWRDPGLLGGIRDDSDAGSEDDAVPDAARAPPPRKSKGPKATKRVAATAVKETKAKGMYVYFTS